MRRTLAAGLLALGLAGCSIGPDLATIVNQGAIDHATEHVLGGAPDERVMCAIGEDFPAGWLIPSSMVVRYGGCHEAWLHASGIFCDVDVCQVLGDAGTPIALLAAPVDPPGRI